LAVELSEQLGVESPEGNSRLRATNPKARTPRPNNIRELGSGTGGGVLLINPALVNGVAPMDPSVHAAVPPPVKQAYAIMNSPAAVPVKSIAMGLEPLPLPVLFSVKAIAYAKILKLVTPESGLVTPEGKGLVVQLTKLSLAPPPGTRPAVVYASPLVIVPSNTPLNPPLVALNSP